jgi:hypothetical protein
MTIQVILVVVVPGVLLFAEHFADSFKVWAAFIGLTISVLDVILLDPVKAGLRHKAAASQELFDCQVLQLKWPSLKSKQPDREDVHGASTGYDTSGLTDWYPSNVRQLPFYVARIICQRSNCWWDSKLRRYYRIAVLCLSAAVVIVIVVLALMKNLTFGDFVVSLMAPILPVVLWGVREAKQQSEASERVDQLKSFGDGLWQQVLQRKLTEDAASVQSRIFQDEIYEHRRQSPMIFDWFYGLFKKKFESQMTQSAADMIEEAQKQGN